MTAAPSSAEDEVVELCRDLLRIDSSNPTSNERKAAEYVAAKLAEVGIEPTIIESEPGRTSVLARIEGADPSRDALLIHGHLDVVPADPSEWSVPPFAGEIVDDMLYGRGAVDMKDMDAMILSVVRNLARTGTKPPRDVVLAFLADEEAGGAKGAHWLVDHKPELFEGCTEAISEVGGFSVTVGEDQRLYLIQTAEKGMAWLRLTARGRAGHGSFINDDNAVTALAEAVTRIGRHTFPVQITPTVRHFLDELSDTLHVELDADDIEDAVTKLGSISRIIGATLRHTANPTMLEGSNKINVIPRTASAGIDGRFLPGLEEDFFTQLDELLGPDIQREFIHHDIAVETAWEGQLVDAMSRAIRAEDPNGRPVPYTLSGGTDAKSFSELGMKCYGFSPLRLPADLDFAGMFHGVDERVPLDSLRFGARVLDRFLADS